MFAYWLVKLHKASKQQEPLTTIIIPKGKKASSIHHFNCHRGMLFIGANNLRAGGFKRTADILTGMNNFIIVSG